MIQHTIATIVHDAEGATNAANCVVSSGIDGVFDDLQDGIRRHLDKLAVVNGLALRRKQITNDTQQGKM